MGLSDTKIKAKLPAGEYPIKLISFQDRENDEGGNILVTFKFPDRLMNQTFFPGGSVNYLGKTLRTQCGKDDGGEMSLAEILNEAKKHDDLYAIVSYNTYGLNLAFHRNTITENEEVKI